MQVVARLKICTMQINILLDPDATLGEAAK